jgi:hypothetical protein
VAAKAGPGMCTGTVYMNKQQIKCWKQITRSMNSIKGNAYTVTAIVKVTATVKDVKT